MKPLKEELREKARNKFYASEHICGHGKKVRFWRPGDWWHMEKEMSLCDDDWWHEKGMSLCDDPPEFKYPRQ